jgi:nucleotide-binding universal stress UspA family protein
VEFASNRRSVQAVHQSFTPSRYHRRMAEAIAFRSILVPVDGSASSDGALRLAFRLVAWDGEIIITHVIDRAALIAKRNSPQGGDAGPAPESPEATERDIFARASDQARAAGISFSTISLNGSAVSSITFLATNRNVDAIVMGTHGRGGVARLILGNAAAGVIRETFAPVFVVHEQNSELSAQPLKTIVVALDASAAASAAGRAAVDLATGDHGSVVFAHVASPADDASQAEAFAGAEAYALAVGVPNKRVVLQGQPVDAIINSAETCHADMEASRKESSGKVQCRSSSCLRARPRTSARRKRPVRCHDKGCQGEQLLRTTAVASRGFYAAR